MNKEHIPEYDRIKAFDEDIRDSQENPVLTGEGSEIPEALSDDLVAEADAFLATHEIESAEQLNTLLEELYTATAINNNPRAKELRRAIEMRYRREAMS
jgi:hypothetical protein